MARLEPGCLLEWPRSAGEAGYQLYVMPSALRICQSKGDVSLVRVRVCARRKPEFNDALNSRSDVSVRMCVHIPR